MAQSKVGKIKNLRTIKALRSEPIKIDLGKTFTGSLRAWLKKKPNDETFRSFEIIDNRYLFLSRDKTSDYYYDNILKNGVQGKWIFDVEHTKDNEVGTKPKTILTGTILFEDDVTGTNGFEVEVLPYEGLFNVEGGNALSIYLTDQILELGDSNT
tara:strand:- start:3172 stop:3636 length:465 start_codon:yes stop_codon:yes gene_type:complete